MNYIKADEVQSLFSQTLATISLIKKLSDSNFLESDYYKNMIFQDNNDQFKYILKESGLGNPSCLQMFLYALLVVPKEILEKNNKLYYKNCKDNFNILCSNLIDSSSNTTYKKEKNIYQMDYYTHIRNAVSHASCYYEKINKSNYIKFVDFKFRDKNQCCEIIIQTSCIGELINLLYDQLLEYLILRQEEKIDK